MVALALVAPAAATAADTRLLYHLEAQPLGDALRAVSRQSGREIIFPADIARGRDAPALEGSFTVAEAIDRLIAGAPLAADYSGDVVYVRGRLSPPAEIGAPPAEDGLVVVTGSRIRGAPPPSPTISISREQMRDQGQSNLGDVVRLLPQNFSGGQNPGVGFGVPTGNGENIGSGSAINLRGLGQDATLTLLNGKRLAYGGVRQSTDITAIPFLAVERIEIVPDGASALYGSDAVAGVANVLLRRSYDGMLTSARVGGTTDGGNAQQQYSALGGTHWASGDVLLAYEYERTTAIEANDRSYTAGRNPGLRLIPQLKHHNALLSVHQDVTETLRLSLDSIFNRRWSVSRYSADGNPASAVYTVPTRTSTLSIAPSIELRPAGGWSLSLAGTYGSDHIVYGTDRSLAGSTTTIQRACYCNSAWSAEIAADGTVATLPAGAVKLAAGAGLRSNRLHAIAYAGAAQSVRAAQDAYFAFGELSLPLVAPAQAIGLVHRAIVDVAIRYEDYPGVDRVVTPKLGAIYAPTPDVEIKATWGKSFKAPTLFQLYNAQTVDLRRAATVGAPGLPASASVVSLFGGNTGLKPERATTWSATLELHPRPVPQLRLEISYFNVKYHDRIIAPVTFLSQALSDPVYAGFVTRNPTAAALAAAFAGRTLTNNLTGAPYDPATVAAIIDNRNANVAFRALDGVDVGLSYRLDAGAFGAITALVDGSYLDSRQKLTPQQPVTQLSGTIFNPPRYRGRGGLTWTKNDLVASVFVNHIGRVTDTRSVQRPGVRGMTTLDVALRLKQIRSTGLLAATEVALSASNLLDRAPATIANTLVLNASYDSTNYSPVGRFLSLAVIKRW
jgi:outer membrane receptor protein involved in Fe transport